MDGATVISDLTCKFAGAEPLSNLIVAHNVSKLISECVQLLFIVGV